MKKSLRRKVIKYQNSQGGRVNKHVALAMVLKKESQDASS